MFDLIIVNTALKSGVKKQVSTSQLKLKRMIAFELFVLACAMIGIGTGLHKALAMQLAGIASLILGFAVGASLAKTIVAATVGSPLSRD